MFPFKKPPSRVEVAKKTVAQAAHSLSDSVASAATSAATTVANAAEKISERAHDLIEHSPVESHLADASEKLSALKTGAVAGLAGAGVGLAEKVANLREHTDETVPDVRRARKEAQSQINWMQKQAEQYKRELEKELAREQSRFESEKTRLAQEAQNLQQKARQRVEAENIVRVPVEATDAIVYDEDGDYDYEDDYQKSSGGGAWLWIGGILLASAGVVYYIFSTTSGRRSKAAIQDRVVQVKEGVREAIVQQSDATGEPNTAEIAQAATQAFDHSNEKVGALSEESLPDKAVAKLGEVSDKVADGIESAGDFIADKLEAAGASAKNAAHSAAEKLDEAKTHVAVSPDVATSPDAVAVEIVTAERPRGETTEEILAEVEETMKNIENSAKRSND